MKNRTFARIAERRRQPAAVVAGFAESKISKLASTNEKVTAFLSSLGIVVLIATGASVAFASSCFPLGMVAVTVIQAQAFFVALIPIVLISIALAIYVAYRLVCVL